MAETDHPNGTCGICCPYCAAGMPRTLEAVRAYESEQNDQFARTKGDQMTNNAGAFDLLASPGTTKLLHRYDPGQPWQTIGEFDSRQDAEMVLRLLDRIDQDDGTAQAAAQVARVAARVDGQAIAARREMGTKFPGYLNESLLDLNLAISDYTRAMAGDRTVTVADSPETHFVGYTPTITESEPRRCAHGKTVDEVCSICIVDQHQPVNPENESPDGAATDGNVDSADNAGHG